MTGRNKSKWRSWLSSTLGLVHVTDDIDSCVACNGAETLVAATEQSKDVALIDLATT